MADDKPAAARSDPSAVRAAIRMLGLLEALNANAAATLGELAAATELPKPTVVRLLRTLMQAGYIRQISRAEGYAVTERVLRLADGFRDNDRVVALARSRLDGFTAKFKWAANVQQYDRGAMCARYSTVGQSPLSIDPARLNKRYPVLTTAHGQAYIAFCSKGEREMILAMLAASTNPANAPARDAGFVSAMIEDVRAKGYALRAAVPRDRAVGFAVPVRRRDGVAATIGIRYFASALRPDEAVRRYLEPLQALAADLALALDGAEAAP